MSNNFSVSSAQYDGSFGGSGDRNPQVTVAGTVNGTRVFARCFFAYLAAANAAGQMQQALTAILWNWFVAVYSYQFAPEPQPISVPTFPPSSEVAIQTQGPFPQPPVTYSPALIPAWTA